MITGLSSLLHPWKFFNVGKNSSKKTILQPVSGFVKEGEMLLVLGRPGAGCSTLLRVLANMRSAYTKINGDVSFGGIGHATFSKQYRGQVVYMDEEDNHFPT